MKTKVTLLFNGARSFQGSKEKTKDKTFNMIEMFEVKKDAFNKQSLVQMELFIDEMPEIISKLNCFDVIDCTIDIDMSGQNPRINLISVDKVVRKSEVDVGKLLL